MHTLANANLVVTRDEVASKTGLVPAAGDVFLAALTPCLELQPSTRLFFFHVVPLTFPVINYSSSNLFGFNAAFLLFIWLCVFNLWYSIKCFLLPSARVTLAESKIKCLISCHAYHCYFFYFPFDCPFIVASCVLDKALACPSLPAGARSGPTRRTRGLRKAVIKTLKTEVIGELAIYVLWCRCIGSQVYRSCLWATRRVVFTAH